MATNIKSNLVMQTGNGVPTHISPETTLYYDLDSKLFYQNKDGISNWSYFLDSNTPIISATANTFTTGATLINNTVFFNRNDILSAYTVDLSSISTSGGSGIDTYVTGVTFSNNILLFRNNTGGTFNVLVNNLTGLTVNGLIQSNSLSATTISATTIFSGGTNLSSIYLQKNGYLLQKNGSVTGSTFSGNPKKATVTFTTPFTSNNYAITITGGVARTWNIESKTASGFTINSNANTAFATSNVFWNANEIGEGYK